MSETDCFVVEGQIGVEALIRSGGFTLESILLENGKHAALQELLSKSRTPFEVGTAGDLHREAGYQFHRGVLARVLRPEPTSPSFENLKSWQRLVFPLGLADPGNLGTVVRNGVAFGADAIVVARHSGADIWSRKAIRASATGVFQVPVHEIVDVVDFLERARTAGFLIFGTTLSKGSRLLKEVKPARKSLVLFGTERDGLDSEIEDLCDELVHIPMSQGMDSLNVGSTAAIVCHHLFQAID